MILNGTPRADFAPMRFSKTFGTEQLKRSINYSWYQDPTAFLLSGHHGSAPLEGRNQVIVRNNRIMLWYILCSTNQSTDKIHTHYVKTLNVKLSKNHHYSVVSSLYIYLASLWEYLQACNCLLQFPKCLAKKT